MDALEEQMTTDTVNGIDINAVKQLVGEVDRDPARGMTNWRVVSDWQDQTWSRARVEEYGMSGEKVERSFTIDIDEPHELGGSNRFANPQEMLLAALNACMIVGYVAQCALLGITLTDLQIETRGDIDLRGFFGLSDQVAPGYEALDYTVRIAGDGTPEQFEQVHAAVMQTSPNFHNVARQVELRPRFVVQ
ncbi:OsmC family protein [Novosphingobium sp. 9U]|uniref:OsmC family protein n=1 Tax=Novosphingobium sp. 9U TaxID=2653158 RepID=UPI0012F2C1B2|nr:OsmC family protein [Novosphingobium sp. 9U]VWX54638.1 OsmC family protein [Novosphingobium sp. 9U]